MEAMGLVGCDSTWLVLVLVHREHPSPLAWLVIVG